MFFESHKALCNLLGFPDGSMVKNPPANAGDIRDMGSVPGWEDPLGRAWQPTPVFLSGESPGQRSLAGHSLRDLDAAEVT